MQQIRGAAVEHICQAATLSEGLRLDFDPAHEAPAAADCQRAAPASPVQKTVCRTVVSLHHGCFQAHEVIRQKTHEAVPAIERSALLADTVAPGGRYAFDLISYIGVESYLRGRSLKEIRQELIDRTPKLDIPISSLWDQQQKFLFYLGCLHTQASPLVRRHLAEHGPVTWLIDGTTEPGTPVFLGIKEATHGILLASWKIPSENTADIAKCLKQAAERYGRPDRVLHDLSTTMSAACDQSLPGVSHHVCHYHLAHDIGSDLYEKPQGDLCKRMRALQVQFQLRKQRYRQTEALRREVGSTAHLMLRKLIEGGSQDIEFNVTLSREVLMAFHFWILDYRSEGHQRGFPFDPYTLYLHRRLVRAGHAADDLLSRPEVARHASPVLFNFQKDLQCYRNDAQIAAAAKTYERACSMFTRLRDALRLSAENMQSLRQPHELATGQQHEIKTALDNLRGELRQQTQDGDDPDQPLAEIVLKHLDKYWLYLVPDQTQTQGRRWHRTTSQLESDWRKTKRCRRKAHGRGCLTRDFMAAPEEYPLVLNLENATYLDLVLGGNLEELPSKLAEASRKADSFSRWKQSRCPKLFGQLPHRLLHNERFIDNLIEACENHCRLQAAA